MTGNYKKQIYRIIKSKYNYFYLILVNNVKKPIKYYDCIVFIKKWDGKVEILKTNKTKGKIKTILQNSTTENKLIPLTINYYFEISELIRHTTFQINIKKII